MGLFRKVVNNPSTKEEEFLGLPTEAIWSTFTS